MTEEKVDVEVVYARERQQALLAVHQRRLTGPQQRGAVVDGLAVVLRIAHQHRHAVEALGQAVERLGDVAAETAVQQQALRQGPASAQVHIAA